MAICPLCAEDVNLLHKRSHLLPEWMYKDYYDDKHKLINVDLDKETVNKRQSGDYEHGIICPDCEEESQVYDHYASLILTDRSPMSQEHQFIDRQEHEKFERGRVHRYQRWRNIDFHVFQKFVYACVLRTHLAEKKRAGSLLAPRHFENIRSLYKDPASIDDSLYPIIAFKFPDDDPYKDLVVLPFDFKISGHHVIEFSGAGYSFWVFASSHRKPGFVDFLALKRDGSMNIMLQYSKERGSFRKMAPIVGRLARQSPHI